MNGETDPSAVRFEPLRPASRRSLVAAFTVGPLVWLVALMVTATVIEYTSAVAIGLLVAVASFVVSLLALLVVYAARRRQERRYVEPG